MKTRVAIVCLIVVLSLAVAVPAMAAYYISISVTESSGTDYDMLAMNVTMNVSYLADNGFIDEDGLDVRVTNSAGSELPFMLAEGKLMFASAVEADKTTGLQMTTGNSLLDNTAVVVGNGGYVTIADHANLELGDGFQLEWDGYIDTDTSDDLISKADAFDVSADGAGQVTATVYGYADIEQTAGSASFALRSGLNTREAQYIDNVPPATISQMSFKLEKTGNPTGTAYIRVREATGDSILGTIGTLDVSTLTTSPAWYDFTGSVDNPSAQAVRFTVEYSGGDGSNYMQVVSNAGDVISGYRQYYDGTWHDAAGYDMAIKVYFNDFSVTAPVESGEHTIKVVLDSGDLKIYEDGAEEDSTASAAVLGNSNDWVLLSDAVPYLSSYTHTTSDTLRLTYEPDSIISGTTLPNEQNPGTHDGTITWGSNPAGISIATSGLEIEESYYYSAGDTSSEDIFEPEHAELVTGIDTDKLDHNPLKPGVEGFAEASNGAFTETLVWYGLAWFITIAAGIALVVFMREHLVFAATASFGLVIMFYLWGIFDYWVLIIFGILFGASLIHERMPTW